MTNRVHPTELPLSFIGIKLGGKMADVVFDAQQNMLFNGEPTDVRAWLQDPANNYPVGPVGDTTTVQYGNTAPIPWSVVRADEYLANFDTTYPEG